MTTKDIQEAICKDEVLKFNKPCENVSYIFGGECDVLSINKNGFVTEFEVKVSRSDFKAEAKKEGKWINFKMKKETATPNYFYYVCPSGLINENEVSDFAGLIWFTEEGWLLTQKKAPFIHKHKHDALKMFEKFTRIMTERKYLGGCRLTYENKQRKEYYNSRSENKSENALFPLA